MDAVLRWQGHEPDWYGYAVGYRRAVEALADHIDATAQSQDSLVFPVGALCRHAIELALKRVLVLLHESYAHGEPLRGTHNLVGMWEAARSPIRRLELFDPVDDRAIEESLARFAALDPSGMAFRYPVTLDGDAILKQPRINIGALSQATLELLAQLEALANAILHDGDLRRQTFEDAAQAWWHALSDDERAEWDQVHDDIHWSYLESHIDP